MTHQQLQLAVLLIRRDFSRKYIWLPKKIDAWLGTCANPDWSGDCLAPEAKITINYKISPDYKILMVLVHELCHVAAYRILGFQSGHGHSFNRIARERGLLRDGNFPRSPNSKLVKRCKAWTELIK